MTTTPASAEPTESDWEAACAATGCDRVTELAEVGDDVFLVCDEHSDYWPCLAGPIARALASQRAEIVARYEAVAEDWERYAAGAGLWEPDDANAYRLCAADIREAAPK